MSCEVDLKAYVVDELAREERGIVEDHVRGCQSCREELDRLNLTRSMLASLEDEEIPRRISFVSDRVFEPRWWQTMWHSGPVMGFASAVVAWRRPSWFMDSKRAPLRWMRRKSSNGSKAG